MQDHQGPSFQHQDHHQGQVLHLHGRAVPVFPGTSRRRRRGALRTHDELVKKTSLHEPQNVTEKMKKDRIAFEIGANNYSFDLLKPVGMTHLARVVSIYQPGGINYILTSTGTSAMVFPTRKR